MMYKSLLQRVIDSFLPHHCAICEKLLVGSEEHLCVSCLASLPFTNLWQHPYDNEMAQMFWHLIPIERSSALFTYRSHSPSAQLLYRLKYNHQPELGIYLGELLAMKAMETGFFEGVDAIIPIPLTKERQKMRGYNQCMMIAKGIVEKYQLPILENALQRVSFHESQTHKNRWQRQENVEQVFRLTHQVDLSGKHLLIIDDVCTTGATIVACCKELMKAGNVKFSVLTVGLTES